VDGALDATGPLFQTALTDCDWHHLLMRILHLCHVPPELQEDSGDVNTIVAHSSQPQFAPEMSVEHGVLSVRSRPPLHKFASQSARINTLVLLPPTVLDIDVALTAGEVWVFGDGQPGLPDAGVTVSLCAGDVTLVDVRDDRIKASNILGDVKLRWDLQSPTPTHIDGGDAAVVDARNVQISATTRLGDVSLGVSGTASPPSWLLPPANRYPVRMLSPEAKSSASRLQRKWSAQLGKDFFL
jgi:hypothetical protein